MSKPQRIQRKRTKGWRLPANAVIVTRPGKWGNPFTVLPNRKPGSKVGGALGYQAVPTIEEALDCYREFIAEVLRAWPSALDELRGKDLACWCKVGEPCHADVLLELANQGDNGNG